MSNLYTLAPTLTCQDFKNDISWSLQLEEISSTDQRGLAFSAGMNDLYTISSSNGSVINYRLSSVGEPGTGTIPTYTVDQVTGHNIEGKADSVGVYARVTGIINGLSWVINVRTFNQSQIAVS